MFESLEKASSKILLGSKALGLDKTPLWKAVRNTSLGIAVGARGMKYAVSPDKNSLQDIINDNIRGKASIFHGTELKLHPKITPQRMNLHFSIKSIFMI